MTAKRLEYEDSMRRLRALDILGADEQPPMPDRIPQPEDDEPLGLRFFRTFLGEGADLSNLTLPRTFFGRSEVDGVSFRNSDLTESSLRWNDLADVDFTDAALARSDLRASSYIRVNFTRANLSGADMRLANFDDCVFDGAVMQGSLLTREQSMHLPLTAEQRSAIAWCDTDGPEPSGG